MNSVLLRLGTSELNVLIPARLSQVRYNLLSHVWLLGERFSQDE